MDPDDQPFYCNGCLFGKSHLLNSNDGYISTSTSMDNIYNILDNSSDIFNTLCPNSIFNNQDNDSISLSDYYCIDELNFELNNIQDESALFLNSYYGVSHKEASLVHYSF